jgi:hypothetical protein
MATSFDTTVGDENVSLAPVVDAVCAAMQDDEAHQWSVLRVPPPVYALIADSRRDDVARGNPVMVLSLDVVSDASVPVGRASVE